MQTVIYYHRPVHSYHPPKDRNGLPIKSCMELFNDITKVSSCMLVCFHYMKPVVQNLAFWKQTFIFYYII